MPFLGLLDRGGERQIALLDHVFQGDGGEEIHHLAAKRRPQVVGIAAFTLEATLHGIALAAGDAQFLVGGEDDFGQGNFSGRA